MADFAAREVTLLGGYTVTIYPTALGEMWRITNIHGPAIKLLGPQSEPCVHFLAAREARHAAAALVALAEDIEATQKTAPRQP